MRRTATIIAAGVAASVFAIAAAERDGQAPQQQGQQGQQQGQQGQQQGQPQGQQVGGRQGGQAAANAPDPVIVELVKRYTLDNFKGTLKGLTQFGDRREGTQRNRDAVQWIGAQLKSYGCEPVFMEYTPPPRGGGGGRQGEAGQRAGGQGAQGQQGRQGGQQGQAGRQGGQQAGRGGQAGQRGAGPTATVLDEPRRNREGGSTQYGITRRAGVNNNAEAQPNEKLRALNAGPVLDPPFPQVYCTKWGTTRRNEMYIVGAHMDGIGWGEAANDDGSGTTLVMNLARVFSAPEVTTDVSIRFALWNGEEGGLRGARAYVAQREKLQGTPEEPKWLGMIQHDMMMWDHGMPRADGTLAPEQRPEADFNIEWQSNSKLAEESMKFALVVKLAADKYSTDYPGTLGPHMTNTDSTPFMDIVPAISLRENERGMHTGAGWNPHWHQPTDLFTTFSDKDFTLGLNAGQATLSAIAQLAGAKIK